MSLKQYSKLSKASLVRKIMMAIKKLPKRRLAVMCYELQKSRLPTISTTKKGMPRLTARPKAYRKPRKTKRTGKPKNAKVGDRFRAKNGRMMKVVKGGKVQFV